MTEDKWLLIKRVTNGVTLKYSDTAANGIPITKRAVIEEKDITDNTEREAVLAQEVGYFMLEHFGWQGFASDSCRVRIEVEFQEEN